MRMIPSDELHEIIRKHNLWLQGEANRDKIAEGQQELRDYRLSLGLSQKSFAALLGMSQASICYWETISPPKDWKEIIKNTMEVMDHV